MPGEFVDTTDPGVQGALTERERLLRLELVTARLEKTVERMVHAGDLHVTVERCDERHPHREPTVVRIQRWLAIGVMVAALIAGYLQLQGMEARIVRVSHAQPKVIYVPAPVPAPAVKGATP